MAGIAKSSLEADDVVLVDTEDHVAECLVSNIFWITNEKFYTPSISTGCKEGVMRKQIITFLNKNAIQWEEGKYKKENLLNADFVFSSNVAGLIPILKIEDKKFKTQSDLFDQIQKHFSVI